MNVYEQMGFVMTSPTIPCTPKVHSTCQLVGLSIVLLAASRVGDVSSGFN